MAISYLFKKAGREIDVASDSPSSNVSFFQITGIRGLTKEDVADGLDITEDENGVDGGTYESELIQKAQTGSYELLKYDNQAYISTLHTP